MKYNVTFLFDKSNLWFEQRLKNYKFNLKNKYNFKFSKNPKNIKNQHIVFPLSYTKILKEEFLKKNKLVLIVHCSKLPQDRGFSPLQYQVLRKRDKIYISLIRAVKKVDAGPIYLQNLFKLKGTELYGDLRKIQGDQFLKIIKKFLIKYPKIEARPQKGKISFNKRRFPKDSILNINKTIKQQFNHIRINDNDRYPSYFYFKGKKYILKIYKENKKN